MFVDIKMPKGKLNVEILSLRDEKIPTCRACKAEIRFAKTPRGKTMPISKNESGEWCAHFMLCGDPDKLRK